jgi:DNA-binding PadR family transcriptional regulator
MTDMKRLTGRKLKPGTLYPLLSWLEAEGYVAGVWVEQGRRNLKRYSITSDGKALLSKVTSLLNKPLRRVLEDLLGAHREKGEAYLSLTGQENSFAAT